MVGALSQEVLAEHPGTQEKELIVLRQGLRPYQSDDLLELSLLLQRLQCRCPGIRPIGGDLAPPCPGALGIETVAGEPVDGGEVPLVGQGDIQGIKGFDYAKRVLGNRLTEVGAGRADCAHHRYRAPPLRRPQTLHHTCPFIKAGQPRPQIWREALLTGHLLQPAA